MSLKKNIFYNVFLTTGLYITQLITYPYVTRVLGVTNIGIYNFVNSFVNFFILISSLGILTLGTREIAKCNENKIKLNQCFSKLFILLLTFTLLTLLVYIGCILYIPNLRKYSTLLYIGAFHILFNTFTVEWFFRGVEDFKYITYRTFLIRILYVILVFIFIKDETHYIRYYAISVLVVFLNAAINWTYATKIVKFVKVSFVEILQYLRPFIGLGIQLILLSYYRTINPIILGFTSNDTEVGYYTTAIKLSLIILLVYNAYTMVMLPRVSSLVSKNNTESANNLITNSFKLLYLFAIPLIILTQIFAPEIVYIIAGSGYEGVIFPMRICLCMILIGGISQILINQVLIPQNLEKGVLISAIVGVSLGICLNLYMMPILKSIGASFTWIISELIIIIGSTIYAKKHLHEFSLHIKILLKYLFFFCPVYALAFLKGLGDNIILETLIILLSTLTYMHIGLKYLLKDSFYMKITDKILKQL